MTEPSFSEHITLPSTVPQDSSYYEMILYNPTKEPIGIKSRNSFKGLKIVDFNKNVMVPQAYYKLFIKFVPHKLQEYKGFFNLKFGISMYQRIK
ncbi:GH10487 [Drosophila grimshawi]|uniref:GH10487 n=1 Tax=Drosophila grimshawi TaxID=7222 RepID=B4JDU9_DROGR|nr:GH10487 [Drosophila grimshawi]